MDFTTSIALGCSAAGLVFGVSALIWASRQKSAVAGLAQAMQSAGTGLEHLNEQLVKQQRTLSRAQARLRHCQRAVRELRDTTAASVTARPPAPTAASRVTPREPETAVASSAGGPISPSEAQLLEMMRRSAKAPRAA